MDKRIIIALLVAVVALSACVQTGDGGPDSYVDEAAHRIECEGKITAEIDEFAKAIEGASRRLEQTVELDITPCDVPREEAELTIMLTDNRETCAYHCGGSPEICNLLFYYEGPEGELTLFECIHIPPSAVFSDDTAECPLLEGYTPTDLRAVPIADGSYIMQGRFEAMDETMLLCAYQSRAE